LGNDTDPDATDNLTITNVTDPGVGSVSTSGANVVFDPGTDFDYLAAGESETVSFDYAISDGNGGTDTATVVVTVNGTNDAPDAVDDTRVVEENTPLTIDVLGNDTDPDTTDSLTITNVSDPGVGSVSTNGANVVFDPGTDFDYLAVGESETVSFDYAIEDGNGGSDTATVVVTVNGTNDAPVAVDDARVVEENTPLTIDVLGNDTDPDATDNLTITNVSDPGVGSASTNGSNVVFDPGTDFDYLAVGESETVSFDYSISDGHGGTDMATVVVTVNGANDAPDAVDDSRVVEENTPLTIDVLTNDTDPDATDNLTITNVTDPGLGSAAINGSNVVFDPGTDFDYLAVGESETVSFDYTIDDGNGGTDTATVVVTVNGTNDAPDAVDDARVVEENTPLIIDVLDNDTDPDATDALTITNVSDPGVGSVSTNGANIVFDPGNDFDYLAVGESETVSFDYAIGDGNGGTDTATVVVTVNGANDAPDAVDDSVVIDENTPLTIDVLDNDTDPDATDNLTITNVTDPGVGSVSTNGANVVFDPGTDFDYLAEGESETVSFDYTISDGNGGSDTASIVVTVNGANDAPDALDDNIVADVGTPLTIDVLGNDTDPDTTDDLTVTGVTDPGLGTVTNNGTNVVFDPGSDFDYLADGETATVSFDYTISDGNGGSDTATVVVTVNGANDAPDAMDDDIIVEEDTPLTIDVLGNDTDPNVTDSLTITSVSDPGSGTVTNNGSNVLFDPGTDFDYLADGETATVSFDYTISDGNSGSDTATVVVTVNGANDAPDAMDDDIVVEENTPLTIDVLGNDTDPDATDDLTVTSVTDPGVGTVTNNGSNVTFDPGTDFDYLAAGESETVSFDYTIDDGNGGSDTATVVVTVNGANDAPDAMDDDIVVEENTPLTIDVLGNDTDPDATDDLTVTSVTDPGVGTVTNNGSNVVFDPGTDFDYLADGETATVSFDYTISDSNGGSDTATVVVTVNGANDAPDAVDDSIIVEENTPLTIDVLSNDTDPDNTDALTITNVDDPVLGSASISGSNVVFDPGTDFDYLAEGESETVSFDYTISDGNGGSDTATVVVTVNGANDTPDAVDDTPVVEENTPLTIDVLSNDADPDATDVLTVTGVTDPSLGTVSTNGTTVTFDPGTDFDYLDEGETATVSFDYTISDGNGGTDTATVMVTVNGVDDPLEAAPDSATTDSKNAITVDVLANDGDPDDADNPITLTAVTQPTKGSVSIVNNQAVFNPDGEFDDLLVGQSATVVFNYTVTNADGAEENESATITINGGGNSAPNAVDDDGGTVFSDEVVTITALSNDTDPDSDTLEIIGFGQPQFGQVSLNGAGDLVFNGNNDFDHIADGESTTVTFDYTISDGQGHTDTATVTIEVQKDHPPTIQANGLSSQDLTFDFSPNDLNLDDLTQYSLSSRTPNNGGTISTETDLGPDGANTGGGDGPTGVLFSDTQTGVGYLSYSYGGTDESAAFGEKLNFASAVVNNSTGWWNITSPDIFLVAGNGDSIQLTSTYGVFSETAPTTGEVFQYSIRLDGETFGTTDAAVLAVLSDLDYIDIRTEAYSGVTGPESFLLAPGDFFEARLLPITVDELLATDAEDTPDQLVYTVDAVAGGSFVFWSDIDTDITTFTQQDINDELVAFKATDSNPDYTLTVTDSRGDTDTIMGQVVGSRDGLTPVVVDLDGDGVEFDTIEDGIVFDADGDGEDEQIAWANEDDAVLVYDENGNNDVDGLDEIAFSRYSDDPNATDLEGLRHFDTNEDLILDANDAEFESFKLWQDSDGDGVVGEGEMMTLSEAGIESLELTSDGQSYYAANGDVLVHGEAGVNYADGTQGILADAEFGYEELAMEDHPIEVLTEGGEVLNLSEGASEMGEVGEDLVEPAPSVVIDESADFAEGGAMPTTSVEDDMASADAAMS